MTAGRWTAMLALLWLFSAAAPAQNIPKELEGWQSWVLEGQEFQRCPFFANTSGADESNRICAWPGRLDLELDRGGGRFTQSWVTYTEGWVPLPGDAENWPRAVTVNGAVAAVVEHDGIPQIRMPPGAFTLAGAFGWSKPPESLAIPAQTGIVELRFEGRKLDQSDRPDGAVWLGQRREAEVAQQLDVQVYRLLGDGIPMMLTTRLNLQVAGDAREEILPPVLPRDFQPMSLDSELPARIDSDGRLRVQVRPGTWTVTVVARASADAGKIAVSVAAGPWPKQEIWSFAAADRLRVAALEGAEGIVAAQANVPPEWRQYPSYRVASGGTLQIVERSRGAAPHEGNHLTLRRELYLDFAHQGFTIIDRITGDMRSAWRLDMHSPYRLLRASSGAIDLLVTQAPDKALTGVELRNPALNLTTVSRIAAPGGAMAASGWNERFDHMAGVLNLPPGHRLLAAIGADSAPQAWVERWGLLDLFLLLLATVITLRLFGWLLAAAAFCAIALVHQESTALVWLILSVLLAIALGRVVPNGWPRYCLAWARAALLGLLLVVSLPFAVAQLRLALYPQLADYGGYAEAQEPLAMARITALAPMQAMPAAAPPPNFVPPQLEEVVVTTAQRKTVRSSGMDSELEQRYAPGTLVQAGPGVPNWRFAAYAFSWSGPVDAAQTVRFVILPPWLVGAWRVVGIVLLAVLFMCFARGSVDPAAVYRRLFAARGAGLVVAALACTMLCPSGHASSTPDGHLLEDLKTRLTRPPRCVPTCAEIMTAHLTLSPTGIQASFDVAALSSVAVALPTAGQRFEPDAITIDGSPVSGVYRDEERGIWIAMKSGAHTVTLSAHLPDTDSIQLSFPQVPRAIAVSAEGWDVSGVIAGRLLGNTVDLVRRRAADHEGGTRQEAMQFPPFVRVRREFTLGLDWTLQTTVQRLAPDKGGFTLEVPLLAGESVLTSGVETHGGSRVSVGFDSNAEEFSWRSALAQSDTVTLTAAKDKPWSEVWIFHVSPVWRAVFSGVPSGLPEAMDSREWSFEYYPRPGESLTLQASRPAAAPGSTLAIDEVGVDMEVGKRSTSTALQLTYRSTQGGRHNLSLPQASRVTSVTVDGSDVPVRPDKGQLPLALAPGGHQVRIKWESDAGSESRIRVPGVDLQAPSSNVRTVVRVPADRWVLYAGGSGVGPAILYWGELLVFVVVAVALGRRGGPLRRREWLLLGLGLSTFSWFVLLLFAVWMFAMRWREGLSVDHMSRRKFNLLQAALIVLTVGAVACLVTAIPFGLLAIPDMRIAGIGQSANEMRWFDDQSPGALPTPWVLSVSIWWYKAAMLLWAMWLAFALVRWLPLAWRALGTGGVWRRAERAPPPIVGPGA